VELALRDNLKLTIATIWGFVLFAEVPGAQVSIGILLIVTTGAIATRQKSR
jgi:hypothetical protein